MSYLRRAPLVAALLFAAAAPAAAHAVLRKSVPAAGATAPAGLAAVSLTFSEALEAGFCRVLVRDAAGVAAPSEPPRVAPGDARHLLVTLSKLVAGAYTVEWRAVSVDGHATEGRFGFTVAP
jgi:methionine-rich copper-binding protein CopC